MHLADTKVQKMDWTTVAPALALVQGLLSASRLKRSGEPRGVCKPAAAQRAPAVFLSIPAASTAPGLAEPIRLSQTQKRPFSVHTCAQILQDSPHQSLDLWSLTT